MPQLNRLLSESRTYIPKTSAQDYRAADSGAGLVTFLGLSSLRRDPQRSLQDAMIFQKPLALNRYCQMSSITWALDPILGSAPERTTVGGQVHQTSQGDMVSEFPRGTGCHIKFSEVFSEHTSLESLAADVRELGLWEVRRPISIITTVPCGTLPPFAHEAICTAQFI